MEINNRNLTLNQVQQSTMQQLVDFDRQNPDPEHLMSLVNAVDFAYSTEYSARQRYDFFVQCFEAAFDLTAAKASNPFTVSENLKRLFEEASSVSRYWK